MPSTLPPRTARCDSSSAAAPRWRRFLEALRDPGTRARLTRAQEPELPREASFGFTDAVADYRRSAVTSRKLVGAAGRTLHSDLAALTNEAAATRRVDIW